MTRRRTSLLFGVWTGVLVLFLGHVAAQTTPMTTTTILKKISTRKIFQDPRSNRTILQNISYIEDVGDDLAAVLKNVAESTTFSNREIYRDQLERSSTLEAEGSSGKDEPLTWKRNEQNVYTENDKHVTTEEKKEKDLNVRGVNREIGKLLSIPSPKITKLIPEEDPEEDYEEKSGNDEEGIDIAMSTTEENFAEMSRKYLGKLETTIYPELEERATSVNFDDEDLSIYGFTKAADNDLYDGSKKSYPGFTDSNPEETSRYRTPIYEKILQLEGSRNEDTSFETTRSMLKDFLEDSSKDERSSVTFSPEFERTEEYGNFGEYTSPDFPEGTAPSTPIFDESHRRISDSIRKNMEAFDVANSEDYKPEESRHEKFDQKAKDDGISLVNDTIVNYSNYHDILMDKSEGTGSRNLTTTLENGTNMILVNTSVTHKEYSPKEEVEIFGDITRPVTLKNSEDKNVELDQESSALTSVFRNTESQGVENDSDASTTLQDRRSELFENDYTSYRPDRKSDDFRNATRVAEETGGRNVSDSNVSFGPKARTIFFNGANDFPNVESKTSTKSNDVNDDKPIDKVFPKKSTITEKPIEQKPYPYTKAGSKEVIVEPILKIVESEGKSEVITEEASAYENTIGRGRSDEKVIVTEPSVVIENSIQQLKPTYYKRSGNLTRIRTNNPDVSSTATTSSSTMPRKPDARLEEDTIERSITLMSNSSTGIDGSRIVSVENDVPRSDHEERNATRIDDASGSKDLSLDEAVKGLSVKSTMENLTMVSGNFSGNNEIQTDAEESMLTVSGLNVTEGFAEYASTKSDPQKRNETEVAKVTLRLEPSTRAEDMLALTVPVTTTNNPKTTLTLEGVTDEGSATILGTLKTERNDSVIIGTTDGSVDSSASTTTTTTTMTTVEYEFVGLTDTTISQNYIANSGEKNTLSDDDQEVRSRTTTTVDLLQGVTAQENYTTETEDNPEVTLKALGITTENSSIITTVVGDAEETLRSSAGTRHSKNGTTETYTSYTAYSTTIPYEQFTEIPTTIEVEVTVDASEETVSQNETVTSTTESLSTFNVRNSSSSTHFSSASNDVDSSSTPSLSNASSATSYSSASNDVDSSSIPDLSNITSTINSSGTWSIASTTSPSNFSSTVDSTTVSSTINIPITSSNVESSSTTNIVDSTIATGTTRSSDTLSTTDTSNVSSTWSIWNTSTMAPGNRIVIKSTTEGPQMTLSADEITVMTRIVFEGTWNDVCPLLSPLKESLAALLTSRTEKNVSSKQIILHQTQCGESTTMSTLKSSDVSLTSVLVYVVDETGNLDVTTTEILPSLYKVSPINFPLTIHSFLTLQETDSGNAIAVVIVSSVAFICLVLLAGLLFIMRKRQTRFNYVERCRPVSLDAYSLDSVSAYNSVRRKEVARTSKRSYGNPTFEDSSVVPSHPLNFAGLSSFCNDSSAIAEEFSGIPQVTAKIDELPAGAEVKNRYANVVPLPETRVPLQRINSDQLTEYINASYVRGPKNATKYYIACQAPIESTVTDFWRMIWEQQSKIIIMLTDIVENGVEKCTEYIPPSEVTDCHRLYGDYQVTLKKRETKEKYAISTIHLKNLENNTFREISHIWYLWPTNGVPTDAAGLIAVLLEARALQRGGPGPIVVHCSPGTGRTGTLIALDLGIRQYEITRTVDVPRVVYTIRRDRAGAVQTKEQYAFIYKALNLYAAKLAGGALESM